MPEAADSHKPLKLTAWTPTPGGTAASPRSPAAQPLAPAPPPLTGQSMTPWLVVAMAVILFAGALFGYDQGVISGALDGIKKSFVLTPLLVEVVTSWVTLGAMFGALAGGELADRFGRRNAILFSGVLFTLGAAVQAFAPVTAVLVCGRLIVGAAVGVIAVAAPLYGARARATDVAWPDRIRVPVRDHDRHLPRLPGERLALQRRLLASYAGFIRGSGRVAAAGGGGCTGIATLADENAAPPRGQGADAEDPAEGRRQDALNMIDKALREETESAAWSEIFHRQWRRPLMIGIGLAVFQQITGINAIIYYANQIFASAGFALSSQATLTTWAIGGVNVAATVIALAFVDRWGRRKFCWADCSGWELVWPFWNRLPVHRPRRAGGRHDSTKRCWHHYAMRSGRIHHLLRRLDRSRHVDRDHRDLPGADPRPGGVHLHGFQLAFGLRGQPVLPVDGRCRRQFADLRIVRTVLRHRLDLDLLPCAGDQGPVAGGDTTDLEARDHTKAFMR